ncbi:hypothetical protein KMAR_50063 [Kluyveromyces marxianus]|nr:hypothetical protein KMAR_50063 [Kluyveromyces marxianus]
MKFSSTIQYAALGFLATVANAQLFSNTTSVVLTSTSQTTSATPSSDAVPQVADVNIVNALTGSKTSYDRYGAFVISVSVDAKATGSVWFAPPSEFGNFPDSIEFDYGTITNVNNNFTVEFTSVPDSSTVTIEVIGSLTEAGITAIPDPKTVTYATQTSSGSFSDSIAFMPLDNSKKYTSVYGGALYYSIDIAVSDYSDIFSFLTNSEDGYSFEPSFTNVYFVAPNAFNNGSLTSAGGDIESSDSLISITLTGAVPDGFIAIRIVYKAIISGSADFYSNTGALTLPAAPGSLTKRDVTVYYKDTTYVKGPKAGQSVSDVSISSSGSIITVSASTSTLSSYTDTSTSTSTSTSTPDSATLDSSSLGSVVTSTASRLSTTVITTCPKCKPSEQTTNVYVSTVTATVSGVISEYTTYCPLTTLSKTKSSYGTLATWGIEVSQGSDNAYTVKTVYYQLSSSVTTEHGADVTSLQVTKPYITTAISTGSTSTKSRVLVGSIYSSPASGINSVTGSQSLASPFEGVAASLEAGMFSILAVIAAFVL